MSQRRDFVPRNYIYIFSYDADLEMNREEIGFVPGGVRANIFAKPNETRVYHALGETTVLENKSLKGTVVWSGDWALIREDDVGFLDVKLTIQTDDGEISEVVSQNTWTGSTGACIRRGRAGFVSWSPRSPCWGRRRSRSRDRSTSHRTSTPQLRSIGG